jgi:hypothetical protein
MNTYVRMKIRSLSLAQHTKEPPTNSINLFSVERAYGVTARMAFHFRIVLLSCVCVWFFAEFSGRKTMSKSEKKMRKCERVKEEA